MNKWKHLREAKDTIPVLAINGISKKISENKNKKVPITFDLYAEYFFHSRPHTHTSAYHLFASIAMNLIEHVMSVTLFELCACECVPLLYFLIFLFVHTIMIASRPSIASTSYSDYMVPQHTQVTMNYEYEESTGLSRMH